MSTRINMSGGVDRHARYTMAALEVRADNRNKQRKTHLANLEQVAGDVHRPPGLLLAWLCRAMGCTGGVDSRSGSNLYFIKGHYDGRVLQQSVLDFTRSPLVKCLTCEGGFDTRVHVRVSGRKKKEKRVIHLHCSGCGKTSECPPAVQDAKLAREVPLASADEPKKQSMGMALPKEEVVQVHAEEDDDDEVEWFTDVSEAAVAARAEEAKLARGAIFQQPKPSKEEDAAKKASPKESTRDSNVGQTMQYVSAEEQVDWLLDEEEDAKKASPKESTPDWNVGQTLQYISTGEQVEVLKKHFDDSPPYYTVRMSDGREKQTTAEKMQEATQPDAVEQLERIASALADSKSTKKAAALADRMVASEAASLAHIPGEQILSAIEALPTPTPHVDMILKALYDHDAVSEGAIVAWHTNADQERPSVQACNKFVEWLVAA